MDGSVREEVFGRTHRPVTIGIVLLISMVAFEAMGVGTAMPELVRDLGTTSMYAWPFVAFLAATVIGTVVSGRFSDTRGPSLPLLSGPVLFGLGLVVAGTAPTMAQLLAGRVLQGLGAGAAGVAVYVVIAQVYDAAARPAVLALISSAWVLPSLIGPPISGVVTDHFSWHWVFLGLVPLVIVALVLVLPAVRLLETPTEPPKARRGLVPAAVAATIGISGLTWASRRPDAVGAVVALVALALLVPAFPRLVPPGTVRAARGIGAVVACRGLLSGSFFAATSYLPLVLNRTHGWSLTAAGMPLIIGSLCWSLASAWQGRHTEVSRPRLVRAGFLALATGLCVLLLVTPAAGVPWLALPAALVTGTAMGTAFTAISYQLLKVSAPGEVGFNGSSAQLADQLCQGVTIGLGGALIAVTGSVGLATSILVVVLIGLALLGAAVGLRTGEVAAVYPAGRVNRA